MIEHPPADHHRDTDRLAIDGGPPACAIDFGPRWVFDDTDALQVAQVLRRAQSVWRSGDKLREFQSAFAAAYGARVAIPTGSGTAALHAAFGAIDLEPGDEVITTPATDIGSVIGLLAQNLIPVFADWLPGTFNTDPADIARKITERTRAILVVHLFGIPCDMDAIMAIAHRYGLIVIEDCAQAHLAQYRGTKVGTFGAMAGFSLGMKTLSTDQGGMVTTSDPRLGQQVRGFLSKGSEHRGDSWHPYARLGTFSPMTDLQAAIGISQLAKLESATTNRRLVAALLDELFTSLRGMTCAPTRPADRNVYYMYPYHCDAEKTGVPLDVFVQALRAEGVRDAFGPYLHGQALHRRPLFMQARTYGHSGFPLRDDSGIARVDYAKQSLPEIERTLPGLGFFHMRNSFTHDQGRAIAAAVFKVAKHYGLNTTRVTVDWTNTVTADATPPSQVKSGRAAAAPPQLPGFESTVGDRAMPDTASLDFTRFGAVPDGGQATAKRNDCAMAELLRATAERGARVFFPRGVYHFSQPIVMTRRRNVRFIGEGGNPVHPGTRLIYCGTDPAGLLTLATALHCGFDGIDFVSHGNSQQVVSLCCDETGTDGLSSSNIDFVNCTFRFAEPDSAHGAGVRLRDSANIVFRQCRFQGSRVGIELGQAPRRQPDTRSNGLANTVLFESCHFFADIRGRRASCVRVFDSMFSVSPDGQAARLDFSANDGSGVQAVTVANCFAIEARTATLPFLTQGPRGSGLIFQGNRIAGYQCAVRLDGLGYALIAANVFSQTAPGATDVWIGQEAQEVFCQANDSRATLKAGNPAIRNAQDER